MKFSRRTATVAAIAGTTTLALVLTGCQTGGDETPSDEPITLTITTFGTMGIDSLYEAYEKEHPNITIEATNLENGGAARDDAYAKIAAGTGLSDVVAIEEGWLSTIREVSDAFVDLRDFGIEDHKSDWLDWKYAQGTDADGRVFGAGLDIGPQGLCFRGDLFEAAGLPGDRDGFAEAIGGANATWESFFEFGQEYTAKSGKAFFHHPSFFWNSFVNQQEEGYYKKDGTTLNIKDNAALKGQLNLIVDNANIGAGAPAWGATEQARNDEFAVYVCPSWMLGVVKGFYDAGTTGTGWDFADVLPGGAANWGGAFLGVSESSEHQKEAADLALWLASPEQQAAAFKVAGPFPSTLKGQELVADATDPFFNDAPTGEIFASRAKGVVAQVKGPEDSVIQDNVFGPVLDRINQGEITDGETAWNEAITLLDQLVKQ
ncbi:extracellular solute-binding protein [Protaetiibacter larvae]|uniref:Extracellular solute-binding protein n=1 Tax=Protaetiibacter larvae TaxID=2592654 RepID=A0A5C1Y591_9MICO|nr:extracellular solute-binding protein [Protaetiibacter larvae]QEO08946.1 extracellular solute-binding protein [Protaetiibacter larvae]